MILILGGTTEGRIAARTLEEAGKPFYYSTKGDEQEIAMYHGIRLQGAMDEKEMERCCREYNIQLLVDAAHPFAEQLHQTVEKVADTLDLYVIRFERIYPPRDEEHITWCDDFEDAIRQIKQEEIFTLLALTGVQSIAKLKPLWQESACCYFRILNRESSRRLAEREGFPEKYLHYYHAGEDERILLQQLHPEAILIKESGLSGVSPEARTVIDKQGVVYTDEEGDLVTSIVNQKDCVFTCYDEKGYCYCAIEKAFRAGKTDFYKPISCHLYPIRIGDYGPYKAVNYHRWDVCKAAVLLGKKENLPVYKFLKEPLVRKFGEEWYKELEVAAEELKKRGMI